VLSLAEAVEHPHNVARGTFADRGRGIPLPAVAPRFSRTAARFEDTPVDTAAALAAWGLGEEQRTAALSASSPA
jgi:alpha-methylacyl-CoA racemase